jgi:hypothetical protein
VKILNTSHKAYRYVSVLGVMGSLKSELCLRLVFIFVVRIMRTEQKDNV